MPLTSKGNKILSAMRSEYGSKKGTSVFYASINKGKVTGAEKSSGHHSPPPMGHSLGSMPTYSTPGTGHGRHPTAVKVNKSAL